MSLKKLAAGVALTTLATLAANGALAQSTASQVSEVVVTTNAVRSTQGLAVQTQVTKDQSIITSAFIDKQVGSENAAQLINMVPGVNYSTEDPTGVLSSDFRMHGFDGNHVSWTVDGTPVNDTGNYAVFPGEYLTGEVTDRVTVNVGQSEVDSPTASAIGGTVNIVSKTPPREFGLIGSAAGGSYGYYRGYAELDTGEVGPWGTRAFLSTNYINANKYKGGGTIQRAGVDFRVYQPLRDKDFISIAGTYNSDRAYFYESSSIAQFTQFGRQLDYNTAWAVPTVSTPGTPSANGIASGNTSLIQFGQGSDSGQGFWGYHLNPVDFADVRVQSRFDLSHGFTLTVDPYFFYTLANGGGSTALSETDKRLIGNSTVKNCVISATPGAALGSGVDLNHDGDCMDTVLVASPSNTQTHRFGVNTSILYDLNEHSHFQFAYTLDHGNHRQTAAWGTIDQQTGMPENAFGGLRGQTIPTMDGSIGRGRDRFSQAILNQIAANYIGKYFDDKLHVNIGVRDPYFSRHLNQFCYTTNGTGAYCDTIDQTQVLAAYNAGVAAHNATALSTLLGTTISYNSTLGTPNFRMPFSQTVNYNKLLPNAGASWNFNSQNQVYVTYAQGFSAPRTDNLYSSEPQTVKPEGSDNYGVGYRFQAATVTLSVNGWYSVWTNHIVTSTDRNDPTISIDRNVGVVDLQGVDIEAGWRPIDHLTLYASGTFMHTRVGSTYQVSTASGSVDPVVELPIKGKELVLTPDTTLSLRASYDFGPVTIGIDGKYTGQRWGSDINDFALPGYTVVNLDASWKLEGFGKNTRLQINATNIGNAQYYSRMSSVANATKITVPTSTGSGTNTINASTPFLYTSAPPTVYVALKMAF